MSQGRHAAADNSFERSVAGAGLRGIMLLAVAVVLGFFLLHGASRTKPFSRTSVGAEESTTTTAPPESTTTTAALRPAPSVKVLVLNGSGKKGAAGRVHDALVPAGYNLLAPTNTTEPATDSAVEYAAGYEREAAALAQRLGLPATAVKPITVPPPVADTRGAHVVIVIAADLAARYPSTTAAA